MTGLAFFLFIFCSLMSTLYLLVNGIIKKDKVHITSALSLILPFLYLTYLGYSKAEFINLTQYFFIAPLFYLNLYLCLVSLNTHKFLRLSLLGFLAVSNLFFYFNQFNSDSLLHTARAKEKVIIKAPGVANLLLAPKHPFVEEVTKFYGKTHKGYTTYIIPSPMHQRDISIIAHVTNKYNGINLIISNEAHEKEAEAVIVDIITNKFRPKDVNFYHYDNANHSYLPEIPNNLKVIFFVKGP